MQGLVLEGGTFRPIYTAGILDALLDEGIMFPYCIGVSAGIANGVSYISRQTGRNLEILRQYRNDKRYLGRRNFAKCKSLFGLDFVYDEIPNKLLPFDYETFYSYEGTCLVGVTNAETGTVEYLNAMDMDKKCTMLRATCALPVFFPAILWKNQKYYDGGLSTPIPVEQPLKDGCDKLLIILTQPRGFVKKVKKMDRFGARVVGRKYPKIKERVLNRYKDYNRELRECERLEREGKAVVLRPEYPLRSFEGNVEQLERNYRHGYDLAMKNMDTIRTVLDFPK